jgi:hypothetical protein
VQRSFDEIYYAPQLASSLDSFLRGLECKQLVGIEPRPRYAELAAAALEEKQSAKLEIRGL